jgi:hypothetical protein
MRGLLRLTNRDLADALRLKAGVDVDVVTHDPVMKVTTIVVSGDAVAQAQRDAYGGSAPLPGSGVEEGVEPYGLSLEALRWGKDGP